MPPDNKVILGALDEASGHDATVEVSLMHPVHSSGFAIVGHRVFRSIENYTADGRRDLSRSHYTINGRKVSRQRYERELWHRPKRMAGGEDAT